MVNGRRVFGKALCFILLFPQVLGCSLLGKLPAFKDGCYLGTAKTWIDANANGLWDEDEKPLAGVSFELKDGAGAGNYLHQPVSDENGEFFLSVFPNTCESLADFELVLSAAVPDGYRPTTPTAMPIPRAELLDQEMGEYLFGFILSSP
ncbi:MAG: hypothetical protein JW748_15785 [Anaerolineales bacterium]|nr:hypothetical protein [Anaerolineales bacterium]